MKIDRSIINICSENLIESKNFYIKLLDFSTTFESDWYIQLKSEEGMFELGIIDKFNQVVPKIAQTNPEGFYLTFVVESADKIFEIAQKENFEVLASPEDTFYGQRRLLLKAPEGTVVDISSLIKS